MELQGITFASIIGASNIGGGIGGMIFGSASPGHFRIPFAIIAGIQVGAGILCSLVIPGAGSDGDDYDRATFRPQDGSDEPLIEKDPLSILHEKPFLSQETGTDADEESGLRMPPLLVGLAVVTVLSAMSFAVPWLGSFFQEGNELNYTQ